jgi:hypothetical protein
VFHIADKSPAKGQGLTIELALLHVDHGFQI